MINDDLMRSYKQYIKQQEIGHLKINFLKKLLLSLLFFILLPLGILKLFYMNTKKNSKLFIFPFGNKEPMKSIISELKNLNNSEIIIYPQAFYIFPFLLLKDFIGTLFTHPLWTIRNLDFFGALSLKVSKYYGYKVKYEMSKLLLFQEYSFYSSYLTKIFENENGNLYNLMHGIPGKEAAYFRFSKCFIWGKYFENYYISNGAERNQFTIVGSIYHTKLKNKENSNLGRYDIVYALQGDQYGNMYSTKMILSILQKIQSEYKLKVVVKQHPIYSNSVPIPRNIDIIDVSPFESIVNSKILISHFSTMLLDAKVLEKKVLAFVSKEEKEMVGYLSNNEIITEEKELSMAIIKLLRTNKGIELSTNIIDFELNTLETLKYAIS